MHSLRRPLWPSQMDNPGPPETIDWRIELNIFTIVFPSSSMLLTLNSLIVFAQTLI
ncbi:hypothetical protein K503DRAFT_806896 [Rhizopogon vinicolor AM-OR11-026]|uniref:Uncharacterized protein n=1 Tax=Rhizopogon vinicolor AM-OR11-026 TaxID=1314800 RepID=A0A1B7MDK7_9AGAM|nr:hypothetical protein K503DRAFT_806896 [Rhizopogon vinicolor AM-OR11-026]